MLRLRLLRLRLDLSRRGVMLVFLLFVQSLQAFLFHVILLALLLLLLTVLPLPLQLLFLTQFSR